MKWSDLNEIVEQHVAKGTKVSLRLIWKAAGCPDGGDPDMFVNSDPIQVLLSAAGHYYKIGDAVYATPVGLREYMRFLRLRMEDK